MQAGVAIPAWRPDGDYSWWTGVLPRLHQRQVSTVKQIPLADLIVDFDPDLGFHHTGD